MPKLSSKRHKRANGNKKERETTALKKKAFLEYFEAAMGIVTIACKQTGIARKTFYRWLEKDKKFKEAARAIQIPQRDFVEDKLLTKINNGDSKCICFYLDRKHPDYKRKSEIDVRDKTNNDDILDAVCKILDGTGRDKGTLPGAVQE